MNQKTLFKLEYDKIITLLEKEATSFRGGQLCRRLKPMTDLIRSTLIRNRLLPLIHESCKKDVSRLVTLLRLKSP